MGGPSAHDVEVGNDVWHWWLEHGLDGIVGGLVGGLVTAGAVWLTLRHERRLVDEQRRAEALDRIEQDVARLQVEAMRVDRELQRGADRDCGLIADLQSQITAVSVAAKQWPNFGRTIADDGVALFVAFTAQEYDRTHHPSRREQVDRAAGAVHNVWSACRMWQEDHECFEGFEYRWQGDPSS